MNKVITLAMMLVFALLASAEQFETVDLEVVEGGSVGHTYFGHHEAQAMGLYPYSQEYTTAWEMVNPSQNINKVRPGIYKFPVKKVEEPVTQTKTKEITEDAPDGGNAVDSSGSDERTDSESSGPELAIGDDKFDLNRDGYRIGPERDSLETVFASPEEGRSPEQPATAQPTDLAASESALIIADLTRKNEELTIREKETEAEIVKIKQESVSALQIAGAAVKIRDEKIARLERELADKSKAEALALGNNGSSPSSSDYFIPIISVSTVYAIGSVGIIILLTIIVIWSLIKVSQLKSDRSRLIKELGDKQEQLDQKSAEHTYMQSEVVKQRRIINTQAGLMKPYYHAFHFPGAIKKATKEPIPGDTIYLPIKDRDESGLALVGISGLSQLIPAKFPLIEGALRSEDHQRQNDAYLLPPRSAEDRTRRQDVLRLPTPHKKQVANAS